MAMPRHNSATAGALLLLLAAPPRVAGWVTISQSRFGAQVVNIQQMYDLNMSWPLVANFPTQQLLGYLWTLPSDPTSHLGLGGSITYAIDPKMCDSIRDRFWEDFFFVPFVTCTGIKAAVARGFSSWAANSPMISFTDVTSECEKIDGGVAKPTCKIAELWVTTFSSSSASTGGAVEEGLTEGLSTQLTVVLGEEGGNGTFRLGGATSAALASPSAVYSDSLPEPFRFTNGVEPASGKVIETIGGRISFNTDLCWYLDSTFCYSFHSVKAHTNLSAESLNWIMRGICLGVWLIAFTVMLAQFCVCCRAKADHARGVRNRCHAWIEMLHRRSMLWVAVRLVFLIAPPAFYWTIFVPCWECFDFEAAATHEVGHILGLSHPDTVGTSLAKGGGSADKPGQNVYAAALLGAARMNASTCMHPWESVLAGVPPGTPLDENGQPKVRDSIMKALTQHNPRVCLSEDDLEALNVLYPDCTHAISQPVCDKVPYNIGWLRLSVWILVPVLLAIVLMLCVFTYTSHHQNRRLDEQIKLRMKKSADLLRARASIAAQEGQTAQAREQLAEHKRTEEVRVEKEARRRSIVLFDQLRRQESQRIKDLAVSNVSSAPASSASLGQPELKHGLSVKEIDELPHVPHDHQYKHGTIGYAAEGLADTMAQGWDMLSRGISRRTSNIGGFASRRSSSEEGGATIGSARHSDSSGKHTTRNADALTRARKVVRGATVKLLGRKKSSSDAAAAAVSFEVEQPRAAAAQNEAV